MIRIQTRAISAKVIYHKTALQSALINLKDYPMDLKYFPVPTKLVIPLTVWGSVRDYAFAFRPQVYGFQVFSPRKEDTRSCATDSRRRKHKPTR